MKLTPQELTRHDEFIDSLVEVEHAWQRSQRNTCVSEDNDEFWMSHHRELRDLVREQHQRDEDSLEEARDTALEMMDDDMLFIEQYEI